LNPSDGSYRRYLYGNIKKNTIRSNTVFGLKGDGQGHLYMGTENGGLNVLNLRTGEFDYYTSKIEEEGSLNSNSIYSIYYSKDDILWVGTFNGGVNYTSRQYHGLKHYKAAKDGLSNPHILSVTEDRAGNLWIGTDGGGLNYFKRKTGKFTCYLHDENDPRSLGANEVLTVFEDKRGQLWVGLYRGGLDLFNPKTGGFTHFRHALEDSTTIQNDVINTIFEDSRGNFYVGTNTGMDCFNRRTRTFRRLKYGIIPSGVLSAIEDKRGNYWIGTYGGLSFVDVHADTVRNFFYIDEANNLRRTVTALYEDSRGHLWIGTMDGLYLFDKASQKFMRHTLDGRDLNNEVAGLVEDADGNLWVSNNHSLIRMEGAAEPPGSPLLVNYGVYDGIKKLYRSNQGEIFFGGNNGLNAFFPKDIAKNDHVPRIVFTNMKIFGKEVGIGTSGSPLRRPISETSEINLAHNQSVITIEFAALNYFFPEKNQYAYFLEGFDRNWNFSGNQRTATYTNLDPGQYVFHVKGSNNDGVWNEKGASLRILIVLPWWKTTWALLFYTVFIGGSFYGIWRFQLNKARMKHELALEHLHAKKLEEVDQMKMKFFSNITHEFRTPLALIIGPIKQMLMNGAPDGLKSQLQMILRNSQTLYQLINQLLDLSKLEAGRMPLRAERTNIVELLRDLVMLFIPMAEQKQVALQFSVLPDSNGHRAGIDAYVDRDKLEKIVSNLLSNAIKFAPEKGQVKTTVRNENDRFVEIKVTDNGAGFSREYLDKIFDRFFQIDDSRTHSHEGTGIGLALSKELVELHHGTIQAESGGGTTFTVRLPLGKSHLAEHEVIHGTPAGEDADSATFFPYGYLDGDHGRQTVKSRVSKNAPLILIVEDHADLRSYLRSNLGHEYQIIEAKNGQEGIELAIERIPDLIVSDVMMPIMDGFEMCKRIKQDERTSHIPVILLTARSAAESRIEGLETGADDYITKPFEMRELQARIGNLIELRRRFKLRFNRQEGLKPEEIAATSLDEKFLKKALSIIEENLSDTSFSVAQFARKIGISRVQLHRKIRALTDQSTSEFIRVIRLNRAAQLLKQQHDTVTQIAFLVGFNSSSYFSRSFCRHFGVSPSEYIKNPHSVKPPPP
jgi:signal transduction histidine kinase/DNA-binding response OmpR family regulator/ligand-binding sensor domain-containing protein